VVEEEGRKKIEGEKVRRRMVEREGRWTNGGGRREEKGRGREGEKKNGQWEGRRESGGGRNEKEELSDGVVWKSIEKKEDKW
jgi:hypothetical protein